MRRFACMTCLFGLVALLTFAAAPAGAQSIKIAIANPAKIFNDIQETKDLKAKMESDRQTLQKTEEQKRQELKDLQAQRDTLKPDSPQYADLNQKLLQKSIEFETWGRLQQAEIQRQQKQQMKSLFDKITATTAEVATKRGIDLVIAEQHPEFPDNLDALNVDQLRALINQRNVLFSTSAVDISSEITAAMDAKYKAGK